MLWWSQSQHSRDLARPFSKIPPGGRSIVAGKELVDLVSSPGPYAAVAFLRRCLNLKDSTNSKADIELLKAVSKVPKEWIEVIVQSHAIDEVKGICPLMSALGKSLEASTHAVLGSLFESTCNIKPDIKLSAESLSHQAYLEFMYLKTYE